MNLRWSALRVVAIRIVQCTSTMIPNSPQHSKTLQRSRRYRYPWQKCSQRMLPWNRKSITFPIPNWTSSYTDPTNGVSYPYTLPAAATAPTATKIFSAAANTGLGNQTLTLALRLSIPANAFAGSYSSTWTYTLVSGP